MLHGNSVPQSGRGGVPRRSVLKAGFLTCGGLRITNRPPQRSRCQNACRPLRCQTAVGHR
jgi:hypothetical protein